MIDESEDFKDIPLIHKTEQKEVRIGKLHRNETGFLLKVVPEADVPETKSPEPGPSTLSGAQSQVSVATLFVAVE